MGVVAGDTQNAMKKKEKEDVSWGWDELPDGVKEYTEAQMIKWVQ